MEEEEEGVEEDTIVETTNHANHNSRHSREGAASPPPRTSPVPDTQHDPPEEFVVEIDAVDGPAKKQANTYAAKKTVAQGMMDIALITANANQLRYIITFNRHSSTFYVNLFLIIVSLLLQVGVGLSLIFKGRYDMKGESKHAHAKRINNYVVVGVFLVTIINVFVASFTTTESATQADSPKAMQTTN